MLSQVMLKQISYGMIEVWDDTAKLDLWFVLQR